MRLKKANDIRLPKSRRRLGARLQKRPTKDQETDPWGSFSCLRKALLFTAAVCLCLNLAWQLNALQFYDQQEQQFDENEVVPPEQQSRPLKDQDEEAPYRRTEQQQHQHSEPNKNPTVRTTVERDGHVRNAVRRALAGFKAGLPRPPQQIAQHVSQKWQQPPTLVKPVPAVVCAVSNGGPSCQVQTCAGQNTAQVLPAFLRQSDPHYGYGFLHREVPTRGWRMQTSGTAEAGSGCAISHKYQFIFVHVLKSGGTTLKGFLQEGLCGSPQLPCAAGRDTLQIVDCGGTVEQYPHYFVFSFVRNPYARMYSAYAMAHSYRSHPTQPLPPFSFATFATAGSPAKQLYNIGQDNRDVTATTITDRRRLQEEDEIAKENNNIPPPPQELENRFQYSSRLTRSIQQQASSRSYQQIYAFRRTLSYLHPSHYEPQTNYLFSQGGNCPVVDFIGHLETLHQDLQKVLTYIDSPELWNHWETKSLQTDSSTAFGTQKKEKDLGGNLQTAYQYQQPQGPKGRPWSAIQRAVAEEYKRDFDLLGYDPNLVPS